MYGTGEGAQQDLSKAFYWDEKNAEQGYTDAQYILSILYYNGTGTSTNKKQAAYWMRKAYDNGSQKAKDA